jgi:hypothetical protein
VVAISRSEQFAERMARQDRSTLKGKLLLIPTLASNLTNLLVITPANMGIRTAAFSLLFSEYHINFIRVKYASGTTSNGVVLGFLDDASGSEGDAPTSASGLLEQRCSAISLGPETVPTEFLFTQKASSFWLKTYAGASGSDPRLTVAAILYAWNVGSSNVVPIELDYSITFQCAVDVGSS